MFYMVVCVVLPIIETVKLSQALKQLDGKGYYTWTLAYASVGCVLAFWNLVFNHIISNWRYVFKFYGCRYTDP